MIVHVGFWHEALTCELPSTTNRLRTSCDCWNWLSTDVFGSVPMRDVPSSWIDQPSVRISRSTPITSTPAERFFGLLKRSTTRAYYSSKVGIHQDQHYKGNVVQPGEYAGMDPS